MLYTNPIVSVSATINVRGEIRYILGIAKENGEGLHYTAPCNVDQIIQNQAVKDKFESKLVFNIMSPTTELTTVTLSHQEVLDRVNTTQCPMCDEYVDMGKCINSECIGRVRANTHGVLSALGVVGGKYSRYFEDAALEKILSGDLPLEIQNAYPYISQAVKERVGLVKPITPRQIVYVIGQLLDLEEAFIEETLACVTDIKSLFDMANDITDTNHPSDTYLLFVEYLKSSLASWIPYLSNDPHF